MKLRSRFAHLGDAHELLLMASGTPSKSAPSVPDFSGRAEWTDLSRLKLSTQQRVRLRIRIRRPIAEASPRVTANGERRLCRHQRQVSRDAKGDEITVDLWL